MAYEPEEKEVFFNFADQEGAVVETEEDDLGQQLIVVNPQAPTYEVNLFGGADEGNSGQELAPVEPQVSEEEVSFWMSVLMLGLWMDWGDSLFLGFIAGFLATGAPGFELKFWIPIITSLTQGLIFIGVSGVAGAVGVWKNLTMNYRSAAFSGLENHLNAHRGFQEHLLSYELNLTQHMVKVHSGEVYTQLLAQHILVDNIHKKLDIMRGMEALTRLELVKQRYIDTPQTDYWFLNVYGVCSTIVGVGGLVCFLLLTPNAMIGEFVKIPDWLFILDNVVALYIGLRAGYQEIKTLKRTREKEFGVIQDLPAAELLSNTRLERCEALYAELCQLIHDKGMVDNPEYAPSTWIPDTPLITVEDFRKQENKGVPYVRGGVFSLGGSGGMGLFPYQPKPLRDRNLVRRRVVEQVPEGNEDVERTNHLDLFN